jgi:hypothetical protein
MKKKQNKQRKKLLTVFLVMCKDINGNYWHSMDLPKGYVLKEEAQRAADQHTKERPNNSLAWVVVKFKGVL